MTPNQEIMEDIQPYHTKIHLAEDDRYENEIDGRLKKVQSDNGTEFVNKELECLFKHKGISHQRTIAYNAQSNGVVERTNRILLDKARTLLIESKLPMRFWGKAVATAVYLKNITLAKGRNNKTRLELWAAYRNKLQPRAKKGIFTGYSQETRGYRIYDPEDKKIRVVKTTKFDENFKGSALLDTRYESMDNDVTLLYGTEQEEDESKEDPIVTAKEMNDIGDTEEINDGREYVKQRREDVVRRRGRRLGVTKEDIENTKKVEVQIREERLREQGVRRSERIENKKQQANTAKHVLIPTNFTQASNSAEAEE
ncbi:hypothetical protein KM043_018803 [Ampulex compressa]|nr:hypothetical protein KM043_018803 [Ampulex compressa]